MKVVATETVIINTNINNNKHCMLCHHAKLRYMHRKSAAFNRFVLSTTTMAVQLELLIVAVDADCILQHP